MSRLMTVLLLTMAAGPVLAEPAPIPASTTGGYAAALPLPTLPIPLPPGPPVPPLNPLPATTPLPAQQTDDKVPPATDSPAPTASQRPDRPLVRLLKGPVTRLAMKLRTPVNRYKSDPNYRTTQLLNESEDLRQARDEVHRFWMNNQPSVLSYERLNGAIGDKPAQSPGSGAAKAAAAPQGSTAKAWIGQCSTGSIIRVSATDANR